MTNDENGLYELSRDLNLSLLSLNNFYGQWTKIKYVYFLEIYEIIKDALRLQKCRYCNPCSCPKTCFYNGI